MDVHLTVPSFLIIIACWRSQPLDPQQAIESPLVDRCDTLTNSPSSSFPFPRLTNCPPSHRSLPGRKESHLCDSAFALASIRYRRDDRIASCIACKFPAVFYYPLCRATERRAKGMIVLTPRCHLGTVGKLDFRKLSPLLIY